jgi:hypothetical protein
MKFVYFMQIPFIFTHCYYTFIDEKIGNKLYKNITSLETLNKKKEIKKKYTVKNKKKTAATTSKKKEIWQN